MAQHNALLNDPNPRAVIGGNQPPLSEALPAETEELRKRAEELIASATERATVTTDDEAERATALYAMMREHWQDIDVARALRKAPFLESERFIDRHYGAIALPLVGGDPKRKITGAAGELLARIDAYRQERERQAQLERRRLAEEARKAHEAAEEAERARQAAEDQQMRAADAESADTAARQKTEAELARRQAEDRAAQLQAQAEAQEAIVIRSGYGPTATGRTGRTAKIINLRMALTHCLKVDRHKIEEVVLTIYNAQLRTGVRELPGAEIVEVSQTIVRRR